MQNNDNVLRFKTCFCQCEFVIDCVRLFISLVDWLRV